MTWAMRLSLLLLLTLLIAESRSAFEEDALEEVQVPEGSMLKLRCTHHGVPSDAIYWVFKTKSKIQTFQSHDPHNETDLRFFDRASEGLLKFRRTDHVFTIPCVGRHLEGSILCSQKPNDDVRQLLMRFDLRIVRKANGASLKELCSTDVSAGYQPDIHLHTLSVIDHEGDDTILQCRAHGDPRPLIEWFDPTGHRVKFNQKGYKVFPNGDLLIKDLSWERDKGSYRCLAVNKYGNDTSETFVYPAENKRKLQAFRRLDEN